MFLTLEQKIIQGGIIHKKKWKVCHFTWYKFYLRIILGRWWALFPIHTRVHSHKLSSTFPFKFHRFLTVFDFLTFTDQEQMLKTGLPLDASLKKKSQDRFGVQGGHKNAACHTMRRWPNFCFKHWMAKLVVSRVALSSWNQVYFRTKWHLFN